MMKNWGFQKDGPQDLIWSMVWSNTFLGVLQGNSKAYLFLALNETYFGTPTSSFAFNYFWLVSLLSSIYTPSCASNKILSTVLFLFSETKICYFLFGSVCVFSSKQRHTAIREIKTLSLMGFVLLVLQVTITL